MRVQLPPSAPGLLDFLGKKGIQKIPINKPSILDLDKS